MTEWWRERTARERRLLMLLGVVALVALAMVAVVRPLQEERGAALSDVRGSEPVVTGGAAATQPDPAGIVAATLTEAGLSPATTTPQADGVAVRLADVPYDRLLRWIAAAEARGAQVETVSIAAGRSTGLVRAEAQFRR